MSLTPMTDLEAFAHNYALQSDKEFDTMNAHNPPELGNIAPGYCIVVYPTREVQLNAATRCSGQLTIRSHVPHIESTDRMHAGTIKYLNCNEHINSVAACRKDTTAVEFTFDSLLTAIAWFKDHDERYDRNDYDLIKFTATPF